MKVIGLWAPVLAGVLMAGNCSAAAFADAVISYNPGTSFSPGYTNASTALGAPASETDPFDSPYLSSEIVSVGASGSLVVKFNTPIVNDPTHPYGLDFIIYGNSGFDITNGDYSGGGITDGSLYGANPGTTRVSVSQDGVKFYTLNPALAPTVDGLFPADGAGSPALPVNPALQASDFDGKDMAGIHALYQGSAGGSGYDLSWAQDTNGNPVFLTWAKYVRVDVLSGKSEIDAFSEVATPAKSRSVTFADNFNANPLGNGWRTFGNSNLFQWDASNQWMDVTWDSSQSNSFFYRPLGNILATNDDFTLGFSLMLTNVNIGTTPGKSANFEIAIGLFNTDSATNTNFNRGFYPFHLANLLEFDYYPPEPGFPQYATVGPTVMFSNSDFNFDGNTGGLSISSNDVFQVVMNYTASNQVLTTAVTRNGQPFGPVNSAFFTENTPVDLRLAQLAIISYSDAVQSGDPNFFGSIFAQGKVGNFVVNTPLPPVQNLAGEFTNATWQTQFQSRSNWLYTLERSGDLQNWSAAGSAVPGNGGTILLQDTNSPAAKAFYRVQANRP